MIKVWKWRSIAEDLDAEPEHVDVEFFAPTEYSFWDHFYQRIGEESGYPQPGHYGVLKTGKYYKFPGTHEEWEIAMEYGRIENYAELGKDIV